MRKYFEILRKCTLFDNISEENLFQMLNCLNPKLQSFEKNKIIIEEGTSAKYVGIVLSGTAQIIRLDYYGNRNIVTNIEPSNLFGESFAYADIQEIPVSVIACEDTEVMLIDCRKITKTCSNSCKSHNQMIFNLLKVMAMKNIFFNQKAEITSKRTTREKLLTYLMQQAKKHNSNSFTIPFDRQELADYLEVDRSGLSAEISKLRSGGIIECHRSKFKLINR